LWTNSYLNILDSEASEGGATVPGSDVCCTVGQGNKERGDSGTC
jgi:hypothetical protein